jgi:hypothetical protein
MPNGGSDNCGTCWFNVKNKGERGMPVYMQHAHEPEAPRCQIREGLLIPDPLYTYCVNHPHHNPNKTDVPIGPVFRHESREVWTKSPDTPEVRDALLAALADVASSAREEYPAGPSLGEVVMWQLAEFREVRALPLLERIAAGAPEGKIEGTFVEHLARFPHAAKAAIEKIARRFHA